MSNVHEYVINPLPLLPRWANLLLFCPKSLAFLKPKHPFSRSPTSGTPTPTNLRSDQIVQAPPGLVTAPLPVLSPSESKDQGNSRPSKPFPGKSLHVSNQLVISKGNPPLSNRAPAQLLLLQNHLNSLLNPALNHPTPVSIPPPKSYASFFSTMDPPNPLPLEPPVWVNGKPTIRIPQQMISHSKESFSLYAIGRC